MNIEQAAVKNTYLFIFLFFDLRICKRSIYLTNIPLANVACKMIIANKARSAKLAIIISYPTRASGIITLLKTIKKTR